MPQPPLKPWKHAAFTAIAQMEYALRGNSFQASADLQKIRNFVFLQYDTPLGSVIHATPLFEALKRTMPDAYVTVAASSMAGSVLGLNPYIDRCLVAPDPFNNFGNSVHAVRKLVNFMPPGPQCITTTIGNQRTRLGMLSLLAGKAVRAGYTLAPEIYDLPLSFLPEQGQIEGNLNILRALGHDVAACEPRIFFTQKDAEIATKLLEDSDKNSPATRVAFVTQNSGGQRNQWSSERFVQVISKLTQLHGIIPIFVGTSVDAAAIELLRQSLPNQGISVAGKTTVPQLAATLAQCDLVISLDTGTFHAARAVGLPGVVIAPAWQSSLEWLPVGNGKYRVLQGPGIPEPTPGYWIEEISVQQVIDAAQDLLRLYPSSGLMRRERLQNSLSSAALRQ